MVTIERWDPGTTGKQSKITVMVLIISKVLQRLYENTKYTILG